MAEFKPAKQEKIVISVRIAKETLSQVDDISVQSGLSRNDFINQCINFALEHYKKK